MLLPSFARAAGGRVTRVALPCAHVLSRRRRSGSRAGLGRASWCMGNTERDHSGAASSRRAWHTCEGCATLADGSPGAGEYAAGFFYATSCGRHFGEQWNVPHQPALPRARPEGPGRRTGRLVLALPLADITGTRSAPTSARGVRPQDGGPGARGGPLRASAASTRSPTSSYYLNEVIKGVSRASALRTSRRRSPNGPRTVQPLRPRPEPLERGLRPLPRPPPDPGTPHGVSPPYWWMAVLGLTLTMVLTALG